MKNTSQNGLKMPFDEAMKKILSVSKQELQRRVETEKKAKPRKMRLPKGDRISRKVLAVNWRKCQVALPLPI